MRAAILLLALLIAAPAAAAERVEKSAPLSLEAARMILSGGGLNAGRIFAIERDRYGITGVTVDRCGKEFTIKVIIDPLEKVKP